MYKIIIMKPVLKTKESQLRAARNYRLRNPDKVKESSRKCANKYYSDPERKELHRKRMLEYYYKKKEEKREILKP